MRGPNPPILLAMILCDTVIQDATSNKRSLIGTFNGLCSTKFPCVHPSFYVFVAITDGRGTVPCRLRMTSLSTGKEIFSLTGQVEFRDPTGVAEVVLQLQQVPFEAEGEYEIEFLADGAPLGSRKMKVKAVPEQKN